MATHSLPPDAAQQTLLDQANAAAAAQDGPTGPARQFTPLQTADLLSPDPTEDEAPPPYADDHVEIGDEKAGLETSARITDDGRVNIRINQFNKRLYQIIAPALQQQVQIAEESRPPPPAVLPPCLNIVIQVVGSRGDVQPFVALGKYLKETFGHRVRLATHPNFKDFVEEHGLEFFNIGGDPSLLMAFMVKNPGLMPGLRSLFGGDVSQRRRDVGEYIQGCWRSCYEAGNGMGDEAADDGCSERSGNALAAKPFVADCIIANPPSFAHVHCAEKLGIPLHIMFTMPYSPTQAFPHPLANIQSSNTDPQVTNFMTYAMIELLSWQGLGDIINRFRKKCLNLDPVSVIWAPNMLQRLKVPHTYCWSPALIPKPKDWDSHISIAGFYFLQSSNYTPAADLQAFLDSGPPPIYIGFGSIVLDNPDAMTALIFEAVKMTGQRVLLSKGWGGIGAEDIPENVFMLGNVPHDWLFKHVSCVVHHGGAGTTAAGIAAGRPTVVVSFFGDQPFWGSMVVRAGAGRSIPSKKLTAEKLTDAILHCLKPESMERAKALSMNIAAERGTDEGSQAFHQHLDVDHLRCTLAPSHAAVWQLKTSRHKVKLSAFAACTLANAQLLDFHDLKLFRPQEYYTDEGPWDPISGLLGAALRAINGMALGLGELPTETTKLFVPSTCSSRQQSQASDTTSSKKSENAPTPMTSASQSQTNLSLQRKSTGLSDVSVPASNTGQSSASPSRKDDDSMHSRAGQSKNQDMLRQRGAHTSKGMGRFMKSFFQSPMAFSVEGTRGFHRLPKLWGDDTVRPQERVTDLKSGFVAMGREFGLGWYDALTGVVMQPYSGARKEGAVGFVKGVGKGAGGFVAKSGAACFGILGHTLKGVHKEVQKRFGSNVQSHIIASRVAQGYDEWLQSSDAEKQDVIDRWSLIQKYLKKRKQGDLMAEALNGHRPAITDHRRPQEDDTLTMTASRSTSVAQAPPYDAERGSVLSLPISEAPSDESLGAEPGSSTIAPPVEKPPLENGHHVQMYKPPTRKPVPVRQRDQGDGSKTVQHQRTSASSEAEVQRRKNETAEFERQMELVIQESLRGQNYHPESPEPSQNEVLRDEYYRRTGASHMAAMQTSPFASRSYGNQLPPSYDPGHLAGNTRPEFEAQQHRHPGEKTAQERTEEDIVMAYIKKQSLLEMQHRKKGKSRMPATNDEDDEELQRALTLSMQASSASSSNSP